MWIFGGTFLRRTLNPVRPTTPPVERLPVPPVGPADVRARPRTDEVLMVCSRCRPGMAEPWARQLRKRAYERVGTSAVTVTLSECVRSCPENGVAMVFASGVRGCWEWPVDVDNHDQIDDVLDCLSVPEKTL